MAEISCPGCGADLTLQATAAFSPEVMTVAYKIAPGRKMPVEELCGSLNALAKLLKLSAKELGASVLVSVEDIKVSDGEISVSVAITPIAPKGSK